MDYKKLAIDIISTNHFLTLATSQDNIPWASTMFYCVDPSYNFYFISEKNSKHSSQIANNPIVGVAIYDSHQKDGEGTGIQMTGKVAELGGKVLEEALTFYKTSYMGMTTSTLSGEAEYRLYRLVPEKVYVLNPAPNEQGRNEVNLKK